MIELIQSLFAHMAWADTTLLRAVGAHDGAFADEEVRKWLHHILVVQRFFLSLFQGCAFDREREGQVPGTVEEMEQRFQEAHAAGAAYTARLDEAELARTIEFPVAAWKDFHPSVRDALMQVIMHSEHHRAQVAMRLRALGGSPPMTDYIIWVRDVRGRA
ncbi:MAG: DinB family protein [Bryobacteraceae bacterium]